MSAAASTYPTTDGRFIACRCPETSWLRQHGKPIPKEHDCLYVLARKEALCADGRVRWERRKRAVA